MTAPLVQTQPLDPVPNSQNVLLESETQVIGGRVIRSIIAQIWMQWFTELREKINVINNYLATWAGVNPVSGVTAATYGDTTHYPIVTVNQYGQITNASNQAISSGASILISTWAGRPGSPSNPTYLKVTDSCSEAIWDGSTWNHFIGSLPLTPPVFGDFTTQNWGTSTNGTYGPFTTIVPQTGAAYALRVLEKTSPSRPFTIEFGFEMPEQTILGATTGLLFGAGWRKSATGEMVLAWWDNSGASPLFRGAKFNSPTSINSVYFSNGMDAAPTRTLTGRFREDNTNRYIDIQQADGLWFNVHSVARTDFITADQVCIAVNIQTAALQDTIPWIHWKQS